MFAAVSWGGKVQVFQKLILGAFAFLAATPAMAAVLVFDCVYDEICVPKEGCKSGELRLEFNVDENDGSAFLIGNNGLAEVRLINGNDGASFLELLPSGAVQTTTMDSMGASVHSRHTIISGNLVTSQYSGACRMFEK